MYMYPNQRFIRIFTYLQNAWEKSDDFISSKCKCEVEHVRFIRNAIKYDKNAVHEIYTMILNDESSIVDMFHPIRISDDIEVKALAHPSGLIYSTMTKSIILGSIDKNGYLLAHVRCIKDGKIYDDNFRWHRLILSAFVENPDPINKIEVNHIDADKTNNAISNLEWVTPQENIDHKIKMGLQPVAQNSYQAIYSNEQIEKVCQMLQDGIYSPKYIEKKTGVHRKMVSGIRCGRKWKSISSKYIFPKSKFDSLGRYIDEDGNHIGEIIREIPNRHIYSDKQIELACKMKCERYRLEEIKNATGVSIKTITRLGTKEDYYKHISSKYTFPSINGNDRRWFTDEQIKKVCEMMCNPKYTIEEVCDATGISRKTIRRFHTEIDPYPEITKNYKFPKQRMGRRGIMINSVYQ